MRSRFALLAAAVVAVLAMGTAVGLDRAEVIAWILDPDRPDAG